MYNGTVINLAEKGIQSKTSTKSMRKSPLDSKPAEKESLINSLHGTDGS